MSITYKQPNVYNQNELERLYLSVGRTLIDMIKQKYKDYLRIAVIAYDEELQFSEKCGFTKNNDASSMFITSLWT